MRAVQSRRSWNEKLSPTDPRPPTQLEPLWWRHQAWGVCLVLLMRAEAVVGAEGTEEAAVKAAVKVTRVVKAVVAAEEAREPPPELSDSEYRGARLAVRSSYQAASRAASG